MATQADLRRIALELPQAVERAHIDHPDFRVHGKIFATLRPKEGDGVLKLPIETMLALVREDDVTFDPVPGFGPNGWTAVRLGNLTPAHLGELVRAAWETVAPAHLVAESPRAAAPKPRARRPRRA